MLKVFSWYTPNPKKVTLLLEELGMAYEEVLVDPGTDAVRADDMLAVSPNGKIPAIVDTDTPDGTPLALFESGAILIYLAEKAGSDLLPASGAARAKTLQWLMWQMAGIGPMIGQFFHFKAMAPDQLPYAIERYENEMKRLISVLEKELETADYVAGNYSIADIAIYPWLSAVGPLLNVDFTPYPRVSAWMARIAERPAAQRVFAAAS